MGQVIFHKNQFEEELGGGLPICIFTNKEEIKCRLVNMSLVLTYIELLKNTIEKETNSKVALIRFLKIKMMKLNRDI